MTKHNKQKLPGKLADRPRNSFGSRLIEQYPKEKIWELMPDDVFLTTTQIGNLIGCTNQCAYMKLRELLDEGKVVRSNISRYYIWKRVGTP